jgi:Uncharacterized protein conserved in bacteria (DUF2188)
MEASMANGFVHVVNERGEWVVQVEGSSRVRSRHTTQAEVIAAWRGIARKAKTELLVHGHNGAIRDRSSYGRDPRHRPG